MVKEPTDERLNAAANFACITHQITDFCDMVENKRKKMKTLDFINDPDALATLLKEVRASAEANEKYPNILFGLCSLCDDGVTPSALLNAPVRYQILAAVLSLLPEYHNHLIPSENALRSWLATWRRRPDGT
jgi:hypothetical protein